ncbi:MAG: AGE family epimerase/isomerase [Alphaproteobacteria bacterium]|nr:AGE family epimerase/isomerase [Alphaproteobacteria bacterium]
MAHTLTQWLWARTLPVWAARGVDRDAGGFHERLDAALEPVTRDGKRAMVQARQVFVFSQPSPLADSDDLSAAATHGMAFLTRHCRHPDGGWRFRVHRDGRPLDDTRDLYTHAFVLFALASRRRAAGGEEARALAADTIAFVERAMGHPDGGFHESLDASGRPAAGPRRQNPHMHLFEAFLEWYAATGDDVWLNRARGIAGLLRERFVVDGTLREFFTQDLEPAPGANGRLVEPGHHFEWVWLLHRYATLCGDGSLTDLAAALYDFAVANGTDPGTGQILDAVDCDGAPHDGNRRLWPQTEALKAHIAQAESTGDAAAIDRIEQQADALFAGYLENSPPGSWREHLAADGSAMVTTYPASSLYHLTLAAAELDRWNETKP